MLWIPLSLTLAQHPKTRRLAALLGASTAATIGHLSGVWCNAVHFAPDGDVTETDPEVIAAWALWDGDPEVLVEALVTCRVRQGGVGFLERTDDGRVLIHEWEDHEGRLMEKLRASKFRAEKSRSERRAQLEAQGLEIQSRQRPRAAQQPHIERYRERKATKTEQETVAAPLAPLATVTAKAPAAPKAAATPKAPKASENKGRALLDLLRDTYGIRAAGTARDFKALKDTQLTIEEVADVYAAIYTGDFGDDWQSDRLSIAAAIAAWDGYQARKRGRPAARRPTMVSAAGVPMEAPAVVASTWRPGASTIYDTRKVS